MLYLLKSAGGAVSQSTIDLQREITLILTLKSKISTLPWTLYDFIALAFDLDPTKCFIC